MSDLDDLEWDELSVGATRPAMIPVLDVPIWFLGFAVAVPFALVFMLSNLAPAGLILVILWIGRQTVAGDYNRMTVIFRAFRCGALFKSRRQWGTATYDPLEHPRG